MIRENNRFYEVDDLLKKYGVPRTNWVARLRRPENSDKWRNHKGPNPLLMLGLDRS